MIVSYDIDGVLAAQPPASEKKWGKMKGDERKARKEFLYQWYSDAERLIEPVEETFHAISARKSETRIYQITDSWLKVNYPDRILSFHLLNESRNIENVVNFKASKIVQLGVQRHYEDNKKVLKGLRMVLPPEVELCFWERGMEAPIPYIPK